MKHKTVIAIYMRLSQDDGDPNAESNSIVNQRHLLYSYVEKNFEDYELLEFQDDGYTGANFSRPGVSKLLERVRNGEVDCIIVKDLSRFSRDYIEIGAYLEQIFPFAGVRFIAVNDRYDSNRFKGDVAGLDTSFKNLMNDLYCKDISVKVKSALKMKKENWKISIEKRIGESIKTKELLQESPDVYVFDGNGYLHPRHMGIATHAGIIMNKPSMGIAKSYYKIDDVDYVMPQNEMFAFEDIIVKDEIYGRVVRTQKNVKPIFLSIGNNGFKGNIRLCIDGNVGAIFLGKFLAYHI